MFLAARDAHGINLATSIAIGDQTRDVEAAHAAGVRTTVHVAGAVQQTGGGQVRATVAVTSVRLASRWLVANLESTGARRQGSPAILSPCIRGP
jgi:histidinol phosphatase-like enzyme